jgi:hypothetical protein
LFLAFRAVFSISIGKVSPNETITVKLGYMSPLIDHEERDQVRFTLPRTYMQRAGTAPAGVNTAQVAKYEKVPFSMNITIQQTAPIQSVVALQGPSPSVSVGIAPPSAASLGIPNSHFARVTLSSDGKTPDPPHDIIIVITANKLDNSRAFIESHPSEDSVAIGLTLVPRYERKNFPLFNREDSARGMEFIVLVDCSNSMDGIKLDMTQNALRFLVKALPQDNTKFNFLSFGTVVKKLWPKSEPYNDVNLTQAILYIE